jgi:hypothetical protein
VFENIERADMICSEYRIESVYYGADMKAVFLAVEESIYEIPLFGEAESITLRDEKVDAAWTDRLRRTFNDLGLEWREPSWHLEVISCSQPYLDKDGRLKPEHLELGLLKSLRSSASDRLGSQSYLDTEASIDDKFLKSCLPGNVGEMTDSEERKMVDWFKGVTSWEVKRRQSDFPRLKSIETYYVGGVRWDITRIDHPTLRLKEGFEIDFNFAKSVVEGPLKYAFSPTDDHCVEYGEVISYVDSLVYRYLYLSTQLKEGVNLDHHDDWQAIKDLFEEKE